MTDARFAGLDREALITTTPAANVDGIVREVLVTTLTAGYFAGLVREVLAQFPTASTLTLAVTEAPDQAAFAATARDILQLALGTTEPRDAAHFSVTVTTGVVTLALAAREALDTANFATLKVGWDLSRVRVVLLAPHDFSAVYWLTGTVFTPETYVPPDFYFTPLMAPYENDPYSAQAIAGVEAAMDPTALKEFYAMSKVITYPYGKQKP